MRALVFLLTGLASALACAADSTEPVVGVWSVNLTPQLTYGGYSNSTARRNFLTAGGLMDAQYLERFGLSVGAARTLLKYSNGTPTLVQNASYASGRVMFTPDQMQGRVTLKADFHGVNNSDSSNESNGVRVFAPQLSYLDFGKTQYYDLGYAYSRYGDSRIGNPALKARQLTPTIGFAMNQGADWLQLRLYDIRFPESARTQNKSHTDALEAKWTHYMTQRGWTPEQLQMSALVGNRLYAVDGDAATVFNLADMQKGGLGLGAQWKLWQGVYFQLSGGYNRYQAFNAGATSNYTGTHLYTGINAQW